MGIKLILKSFIQISYKNEFNSNKQQVIVVKHEQQYGGYNKLLFVKV